MRLILLLQRISPIHLVDQRQLSPSQSPPRGSSSPAPSPTNRPGYLTRQTTKTSMLYLPEDASHSVENSLWNESAMISPSPSSSAVATDVGTATSSLARGRSLEHNKTAPVVLLPPRDKSWSTSKVTPAPYIAPASAQTLSSPAKFHPSAPLDAPQPYIPPHPTTAQSQSQLSTEQSYASPPQQPISATTSPPIIAPELPWRPIPTTPLAQPIYTDVHVAEQPLPQPLVAANPPPQLPPRPAAAPLILTPHITSGPTSIVSTERRSMDLLRTPEEPVKLAPHPPPRGRSISPGKDFSATAASPSQIPPLLRRQTTQTDALQTYQVPAVQPVYQMVQATQSMPFISNNVPAVQSLQAHQAHIPPVPQPNTLPAVNQPPPTPQRPAMSSEQSSYYQTQASQVPYSASYTAPSGNAATIFKQQPQQPNPEIASNSIYSASSASLPIPGDDDSYLETYLTPEMMEDDSDDNIVPSVEETERLAEYPDSSRANRRPPISRSMPHEISCKYDVKVLCISGDYICTSSSVTKVWSVSSGTCVGVISHENFRITAMGFKPSRNLEEEGRFIWLGTKEGGLLEGDLGVMRVTSKRLGVHTTAIKGIYRCGFEMWTLDEDGRVQIWGPDAVTDGLPNLAGSPKSQRGPSALQAGIVVRDQLWIGRNKAISVFKPSAAAEQTQFALSRPIAAARPVGEISCAAILTQDPEHVYFGHDDGKISVYSVSKMTCVDVVSISIYKVTAMAGVGNNLWIGFRTGMIYVYDVSQRPWVVLKDWKAHEGPVMSLMVDRSSIFKMKRLPVVTMTHSDNVLTIWDGMLRHDWLERNMQEHDTEFCSFRAIRTLVCTWNVGAAKPADLQSKSTDSKFLKRLLAEADDPEIIVFGFQELVELDNKTVTAST